MADISLLFEVEGGGQLSGESGKVISGQLQSIVNEINKSPYQIKFMADQGSLTSIKDEIQKAFDGIGPGKEISENISKSISAGVSEIVKSITELGTKGSTEIDRVVNSLSSLLSVVEKLNSKEFGVNAIFKSDAKADSRIAELELYQQYGLETIGVINRLISAYNNLDSSTKTSAMKGTDAAKYIFSWRDMEDEYTKDITSKSLPRVKTAISTLKIYFDELYKVTENARRVNPNVAEPDITAWKNAGAAIDEYTKKTLENKNAVDEAANAATNPFAKLFQDQKIGIGGLDPEGMKESVTNIADSLDDLRAKIESTFDLSTVDLHEGSIVEKISKIGESVEPIVAAFESVVGSVNELDNSVQSSSGSVKNLSGQLHDYGAGILNMPSVLDEEQFHNLSEALKTIEHVDDAAVNRIAQQFTGVEGTVTRIRTYISNAADEEERLYKIVVDAENAQKQMMRYTISYSPNSGAASLDSSSVSANFKAAETAYQKLYDSQVNAAYKSYNAQVEASHRAEQEITASYNKRAMAAETAAEKERLLAERELQIIENTVAKNDLKEMNAAYDEMDRAVTKAFNAMKKLRTYSGDDAKTKEALRENADAANAEAHAAKRAAAQYSDLAKETGRLEESQRHLNEISREWSIIKAQNDARDSKSIADGYEKGMQEVASLQQQLIDGSARWNKSLTENNQFSPVADRLINELNGIIDTMQQGGVYTDYLRERVNQIRTEFKMLGRDASGAMNSGAFVQGSEEWGRALQSVDRAIEDVTKKLSKMSAAKTGKSSESYKELVAAKDGYKQLRGEIENVSVTKSDFISRSQELGRTVSRATTVIRENGEEHKSLGEKIKDVASRFTSWISATRIIMMVIRSMKEMIKTSIELDNVMNQLQIVTKASNQELAAYGKEVAATAKEIGASMTDLIDSATVYSRLGYSLDESSVLAKYTSMLKEVGDIDVSTAQDAVTAITKAFSNEIQIDDIESVMDRLVEVGKELPRYMVTYIIVIGYNGQRRSGYYLRDRGKI